MKEGSVTVLNEWLLTPTRVAIHLPTATAVIADLHLGYSQARRRRGEAIPQASLKTALEPLASTAARHGVTRLVIAGDLFEGGSQVSLTRQLVSWLEEHSLELAGVAPGNHDRGLTGFREVVGTRVPICPEGVQLGRWRVVHGDAALPSGPVVQGHEHPCLRWGGQIAAPCYLVGEDRLILPAYSAEAAGGNVLRDRRWDRLRCLVIGKEVLDFGVIGETFAGGNTAAR